MSAGAFIKTRYAADYGAGTAIHPIRVQPETTELVVNTQDNDPPAGAVTNPISAVVSRGKRARGLRPRLIALRTPSTSPPAGYLPGGIIVVPALNNAVYAAAEAADEDTTVTYLGLSTFKVAYVSQEEAR
jgi:hypothetical protein